MARKGLFQKTFTFEGKRYYATGKTEQEAIMKMANKLRDLEEGKTTVSSSMPVKVWAERAVETYKTNQSERSRYTYVRCMEHCVLEHIGNMPLKSVKPLHCQEVLNVQAGNSKRQIDLVYQILRFIFGKAKANKLIAVDPTEDLIKPKGTVSHRRSITAAERDHLFKVADADSRYVLFLLMLQCGCRPSEAMNVEGRDIQTLDGYHVLHIRGTKSSNADRTVPLPEDLYHRIKNTEPFAPVVTNTAGKRYNSESYKKLTSSLYRAMNLSMGCRTFRNQLVPPYPLADDFVPYDLRHTYCTDLQKAGVDIRTAQKLMGHSDITLTANIYTHSDDETIKSAAQLLNNVK